MNANEMVKENHNNRIKFKWYIKSLGLMYNEQFTRY